MNKKLIALAIASAFVAPAAMADSANVKISGQLHMSVDSINGKGSSATDNKRATNVSSNASNIVFSGDEDLGNGLKALWSVQSYMTMGGTGNSDSNITDGLSNGASYAGVTGGFGAVLLGKLEAPFKVVGRKVDLFGNQVGDGRNLTATGLWDLRPKSTVAYASPDMSGFKAVVAYSTSPLTAATAAGDAALDTSTTATVVSGTYENGPLFAAAAYQQVKPNAGTAGETAAKAWRLAGSYKFGDAKVVALYQSAKDQTMMNPADDDRKVWGVGGSFAMGASTLKAQYYKAGKLGNTANSGANMWALGVDHAMSKRTTAYVAYATTKNDSAAAFSAMGGGHGDNPGTLVGKNPSALSLGMIHNF
jgi:predicted porin